MRLDPLADPLALFHAIWRGGIADRFHLQSCRSNEGNILRRVQEAFQDSGEGSSDAFDESVSWAVVHIDSRDTPRGKLRTDERHTSDRVT